MVSLWGSKSKSKGADEEQDGSSDTMRASSSHNSQTGNTQAQNDSLQDPDERTRLLAQHQVPGYLSPDDPAVSPYNLWSVRALRGLLILFFFITCLWWVLLFISIFISPPQMHTRGSGFFDVAFTTLTIGNILVVLIFFAVPSAAMTILSMTICVLLLVDMIIIVAVTRLREQEGWIGITSVVWATLIALYTIITNRAVTSGKAGEEERLTGRAENRRTVKEWLAVLLATIFMVLFALIAVFFTATLAIRASDASLAAPGKMYLVDGDKYEVHVSCVGNTTADDTGKVAPTVLVEGGYMPVKDSFESWIAAASTNGTIGRYCYWDRAGMGWSDNAPSPHSAGSSADALSEALALAGEHGPFLLVSAGMGSIYSRVFASRNVRNIAGMMFIEGLHESYLPEVGGAGRGFVLWGRGIISPLGIDRLFGALFKGRTREDRVYGRSSYQDGKFIKNKLQENLAAVALTKTEVSTAVHIQDPGVPLIVVSSSSHEARDSNWKDNQEKLTSVTDNLLAWVNINGTLPKSSRYEEIWKIEGAPQVLEEYLGQLYINRKDAKPKEPEQPETPKDPETPKQPNNQTTPNNGNMQRVQYE